MKYYTTKLAVIVHAVKTVRLKANSEESAIKTAYLTRHELANDETQEPFTVDWSTMSHHTILPFTTREGEE